MILDDVEHYLDEVLRPRADVEQVGPFSLFVPHGATPYYARPSLGAERFTAADVTALVARQRELGLPVSIEWVHDTTPALLPAVREAGMGVQECPLLVLAGTPTARPVDLPAVLVEADDPLLARVRAAVHLGFAHPGTSTGPVGAAERDAAGVRPDSDAEHAAGVAAGLTVVAAVVDAEAGPVGGGSHRPRGTATEIVAVAVLPAFRRRGYGAALTAALAQHALDHGATTVLCGAEDATVARVYESVGFTRVGTTCVATA